MKCSWSGVRVVRCLSVTESSYNNSLADRYIWSTIKTLPATLPEPSSEARGPQTGVTVIVSLSDLDLIKGGGAWIGFGLASKRAGLLDWLTGYLLY